jgi:hypothetical protein
MAIINSAGAQSENSHWLNERMQTSENAITKIIKAWHAQKYKSVC